MTYIPAELRRRVIERAGNCCAYCLLSQEDLAFSFHIEHIIVEKHNGETIEANLGLSCPTCNAYKGSDLSSVDWDETGEVIPLFHPRKHQWEEHFILEGAQILPHTAQGRVTVFLLKLNSPSRLAERRFLIRLKRYPCSQRAAAN